jgi:hypothetical protein
MFGNSSRINPILQELSCLAKPDESTAQYCASGTAINVSKTSLSLLYQSSNMIPFLRCCI